MRIFFAIALCTSALTGCADAPILPEGDRFSVAQPEGGDLLVERFHVEVPENRQDSESRTIRVAYFKVAGEEGAKGAPIFMLPGGPGGSYSERIVEGSDRTDRLLAMLSVYRKSSDVYFIDLRGVIGSEPNAKCPNSVLQWRGVNSVKDLRDIQRIAGQRCRQHLIDEGFDIQGYNVIEAAADVVAVADAIGADKVRLHGHSFGTHWAMVTARYHPDRIERMVISGVEGFDDTFDDPIQVRASMERISEEAEEVWDNRHGVAHPLLALDAYMADAAQSSDASTLPVRPYEMRLMAVAGPDYSLSSRSGMAGWPAAVDALVTGDTGWDFWWMRNIGGRFIPTTGGDGAAVGMFDCASWITPKRLEQISLSSNDTLLADTTSAYLGSCEGWDITPLASDFFSPGIVEVPTLMVQGDLDTSTPMANAQAMTEVFINSQITTIVNGSHNALAEAVQGASGFDTDLLGWMRSGKLPQEEYGLAPVPFDDF